MDAGTAVDATALVDGRQPRLRVDLDGIHRTAPAAGPDQIGNGIIRARLGTFATLLTFGWIDVRPLPPHLDGIKAARLLAGLSHTFSAVIGYRVRCDRTLLTGCPNDLDHVSGIFAAGRAFALCQADTLTDNLALFINATAELCLRSRDDSVRNLILVFLIQLAVPCQLCYLVKYVMLDT